MNYNNLLRMKKDKFHDAPLPKFRYIIRHGERGFELSDKRYKIVEGVFVKVPTEKIVKVSHPKRNRGKIAS